MIRTDLFYIRSNLNEINALLTKVMIKHWSGFSTACATNKFLSISFRVIVVLTDVRHSVEG